MNKKGFTLIELLVVVAIIGLLSTLAVVALSTAREKTRDSKRLSDLKNIQTALELHYTGTLECENAMGEDFNEPYVFPKKEPHSNSKGKEFGFSTSDLLALKRIHERERASRFGLRDSSPFIEKQDSPFENERPSDRFSKKLFSFIDQQDSKLDEGSKSDYLSSNFIFIKHLNTQILK